MKLITFDSSIPLGVKNTSPLYPLGATAVSLNEALDSFSIAAGKFNFPLIEQRSGQWTTSSAPLLRERDLDHITDSVRRVAEAGDMIAGHYNRYPDRLRTEISSLETSRFAQKLRASFHMGNNSPWYVGGEFSRGIEEGITFFNLDGRIISLHGFDERHFIVGFGLMGAAMCYVQVNETPMAGNELALFGIRSVAPETISADSLVSLTQPIKDYYVHDSGVSQVGGFGFFNGDGRPVSEIFSDERFDMASMGSVAEFSSCPPWNRDQEAREIPMARISYHPGEGKEGQALLLTSVYASRNSPPFANFFRGIFKPLSEAFSPR
ncbi:MAG: hypothetical protein IPJ69_11590 [Deltaproteobacteria bacterium]|nr:MAG: hypothetical protein IPJ69_11590 [Deltaproteobacteria bacterium]